MRCGIKSTKQISSEASCCLPYFVYLQLLPLEDNKKNCIQQPGRKMLVVLMLSNEQYAVIFSQFLVFEL